jgi:hypothetical protein
MQRRPVDALGQELLSHDCTTARLHLYDLTETLERLVQLVEDTMTLGEPVFPIRDCGCSECMTPPPLALNAAESWIPAGGKQAMTNIESNRFFCRNDQELS